MIWDKFTTAYIEAALWSETDESTPSGGEPLDKNYTADDIHSDTMLVILGDCTRFQAENAQWITEDHCVAKSYPCEERAGHDFLLTRNHHGCGFWDGDWSEEAGKALTEAAHAYGTFGLYVGDDGKIYHHN